MKKAFLHHKCDYQLVILLGAPLPPLCSCLGNGECVCMHLQDFCAHLVNPLGTAMRVVLWSDAGLI